MSSMRHVAGRVRNRSSGAFPPGWVAGCTAAGVLLAATAALADAPSYRAQVFPPVQRLDTAVPMAIDEAGVIVGLAAPKPFHPQSIPIRVELGVVIQFSSPFDAFNQALGNNDGGEIVGMAGLAPARVREGAMELLIALPGFFNGAAWDVSNTGVVCGNFINDVFGHDVPVYWPSLDAEPLQLPGIGGSSVGAAFAINDAGQIAGVSVGSKGGFVAVRWDDPRAEPFAIGTLPDGTFGEGRAINARGDVAGRSSFEDFSSRAMLFNTETGQRIDLGVLGGNFSEARGVNDQLHVVGASSTGLGTAHGFLWQDGVLHDLNELVVVTNGDFDHITAGVAINNAGQIAAEVALSDATDAPRRIALLTPCGMGDLDCDGVVGFADLLALLTAWGPCSDPPASCPEDLDDDGTVGFGDLLILLTNWG